MNNSKNRQGNSTLAIHVGEEKFGVSGPVGVPITRTSGFTFANSEEMKRWAEGKSSAYIYTRYGNPTLTVAEAKIAALEGGEAAVVTASGAAAISAALLAQVRAGDEIIATAQLYGGSYRLMRDIFPRFGIRVRFVGSDLAGVERMVSPRTKALYIETPTNPTLRLVDLAKAAAFANEWGIVAIIDNTFATPILQKPLDMGFHLSVHSASKYLAGHSDLIAGAAVGSAEMIRRVREYIIYLGGSMDPGGAFLLIRGMKTLGVRMEKQCETAAVVAKFLAKHPKVARVMYPGLPSHPDHQLAKKQMKHFGAMLAFDLKGGIKAARRFSDRIRVFLLAASLGGVESLVSLPMYTSHYKMTAEELRTADVTPGTVRVSVGLEDAPDLVQDLRQALA
ncbi:MAG TPA: aminotransferase class I/II-fold pyridoxal phosphate-dependent enzyme [Candidatus Acidoferrum sp.]|jgi:methionine-gamma-lyase|nr:aminotransferase class I/II-fold pyridoxal phosphate-dependent enzyme [Candidatus Acidoferrum sp.]